MQQRQHELMKCKHNYSNGVVVEPFSTCLRVVPERAELSSSEHSDSPIGRSIGFQHYADHIALNAYAAAGYSRPFVETYMQR
jgi:hypothetical protein